MNLKFLILGIIIVGFALILIFPENLGVEWISTLKIYLRPIAEAKVYNIEVPVIVLLIGLILLFVGLKK